jgi:ferredoxin
MAIPEELKSYAIELGYPGSETLGRIFEILFTEEDEIKVVAALPGTSDEIAQKTGLPKKRAIEILTRLMTTGSIIVDFSNMQIFRRFPVIIFMRDSCVHNPETSQEQFELWDKIALEESSNMVKKMKERGVPATTRVLPIEKTVESQNTVLDVDSARKLFSEANLITAAPCVCRLIAKKNGRGEDCPAPPDAVCMQTNFFAAGILGRQIGEKLTKEEALRRIGAAEDAGLVHMVRNNVHKDMFMCNCCSCCCTGFEFYQNLDFPGVFAPSRFQIKSDPELCSACGECEPKCQFHAITIEDTVKIDMEKCHGCGNCAHICPEEALMLEEIRPVEHIRVKGK